MALESNIEDDQKPDSVRALKQLIQRELDKRPNFEPVWFRVAIPRAMKLPSGRCGSYSYMSRSGQIPNSAAWIRGMEYLLQYSGYVIIHGTDTSEIVLDIDQAALQRADTSCQHKTEKPA